jgi:hypothetical protein
MNKEIGEKRKRKLKESEKHKVLKKVAKRHLVEYYNVREEDIYEDFPMGDHVFDIIAFPRRSREGPNSFSLIAYECGNIKGNCIDCLKKINDMLDFVDIIIWIPYSIYHNPAADIINRNFQELDKKGNVIFSTEEFDLKRFPLRLKIVKNEKRLLKKKGIRRDIRVEDNFISSLAFMKKKVYDSIMQKDIELISS